MDTLINYDAEKNPQGYMIMGVPLSAMSEEQFASYDLATRKQILDQPYYTAARAIPAKIDPAKEIARLDKAAKAEAEAKAKAEAKATKSDNAKDGK